MITKIDKNADRIKRHQRVRKKVSGTAECPRLCVFRSLNHIYAQIIDDVKGNTLVACSTVEKAIADMVKEMSKKEAAKVLGQEIAKRALEKGIKEVVFDRGGYIYTGRVECVADGAREAGLVF
ncbi:MAG: 50S ribosomal protein L18 [Clostridia bacterium]|nr:50S ribosomal protein L18 [Clostridia bacterium]